MKKFLGSGGLGDALICFSKCFNFVEEGEKFHFTYIDNKDNRRTKVDYVKYAKEFLEYQDIDFNIVTDDQIEFYKKNARHFDYLFSPQVCGKIDEFLRRPGSVDVDSKPYLNFKVPSAAGITREAVTIVSFAGNNDDNRRKWNSEQFLRDLIKYLDVKLNYQVFLIGIADEKTEIIPYCVDLRWTQFMEQLAVLNISKKVVCFSGFIHLFSCFLNKQVIVKWENEAAKTWYFHPSWLDNNVKFWYDEKYSEIIDKL